MKQLFTIVLVILISGIGYSQNSSITGLVINQETSEPIPLVDVYLVSENDSISQKSNYSGRYSFDNLYPGQYRVYTESSQFSPDTLITVDQKNVELTVEVKGKTAEKKDTEPQIVFMFYHTPTATTSYIYLISPFRVQLIQEKLKRDKKDLRLSKKVKEKETVHVFTTTQQLIFQDIVNDYKLDSAGLYTRRITHWGMMWYVEFMNDGITYKIELPNYHNQGLEELLNFASGLIPRKEKSKWIR